MSRRLKQSVVVLLILFAAAQLVRPNRANPPIDDNLAIQAHVRTPGGLVSVLDRACGDCHSNATVWPSYTQVAPASWLMAYGVTKGRSAVNFSEWGGYSPAQRRVLLSQSCDDVKTGKMPGIYTLLRPETRLSASDIETICAAARQVVEEKP